MEHPEVALAVVVEEARQWEMVELAAVVPGLMAAMVMHLERAEEVEHGKHSAQQAVAVERRGI